MRSVLDCEGVSKALQKIYVVLAHSHLAANPVPDGLEEVGGDFGGVLAREVADGVHDLDADVGDRVLEEVHEGLGGGLAEVGLVLEDLDEAAGHLATSKSFTTLEDIGDGRRCTEKSPAPPLTCLRMVTSTSLMRSDHWRKQLANFTPMSEDWA